MTDFDSRLEALRRRFNKRLRDQTTWLIGIREKLLLSGVLEQNIKEMLSDEAHKLAGISSSLGHPLISHAASDLEALIANSASADDVVAAIQRLLSAIQIALASD